MEGVEKQKSLLASNSEDDSDLVPATKVPRLISPAPPTTKRTLLPSAASLLGKKPTQDDASEFEDPTKHDGRLRSFKHERGNWATYVCVPVEDDLLEDFTTQCIELLSSLNEDDSSIQMQTIKEVHLSLSKTVILQYHLIDSFVESLEKALAFSDGFTVSLQNLKIYTNEEKTRTFVALQVDQIYSVKLKQIVNKIDGVLLEYKLPVFYSDPSFHISFLWCLGDQMKRLEALLPKLQELLAAQIEEELLEMDIKELRCKSGNKEFNFKLK